LLVDNLNQFEMFFRKDSTINESEKSKNVEELRNFLKKFKSKK